MRRPAVDPRPSGLGYSCFVPPLLAMAKAKNSTSHLPRSDLALLHHQRAAVLVRHQFFHNSFYHQSRKVLDSQSHLPIISVA
jgi:hypothetical protein